MAKEWRISNVVRKLRGEPLKAGGDLEEEQIEEAAKAEKIQTDPAPGDDPMAQIERAAQLPELKGALLEVWHKWSGDYSPPCLSLMTGKSAEDFPMDEQLLKREVVRLMVQLEQDAKRRLQCIEQAEKNEGQSLDAFCQIYLSRDKMVAWSFVFPPFGPNGTMRGKSVGYALEQSGVTTGIDSGSMVHIFNEPLYFKLVPIAIGTPAVQGIDGRVTEKFPREITKEVKVDENGIADYRTASYVQVIEKNAVICDIDPPQQGTAGLQVDGKVVEPKPVKAAKIPAGANTTVTEDGRHLIASREGHLEFSHGLFHVRPLLEINGDVDYSTGNIDFPGDVHVKGDVRENFTVRASGTIMIDGMVEAAAIEAGKDLVITRGVVGDNRALIKSGGSVRVKYLENCVVYAAKQIFADCIMNSSIFSDDAISVMSGRGSIIGGALSAAHTIKAHMIGAQSGRRTELTLGVLPYLQNEIQDINGDLSNIHKEQAKLDKELAFLENSQGLQGVNEKLAKARMRKSVLGMKEQQLKIRREHLETMEPELSLCRIECDVIYPITSLTVSNSNWTARRMIKPCKIVYDIRTEELKEIL